MWTFRPSMVQETSCRAEYFQEIISFHSCDFSWVGSAICARGSFLVAYSQSTMRIARTLQQDTTSLQLHFTKSAAAQFLHGGFNESISLGYGTF